MKKLLCIAGLVVWIISFPFYRAQGSPSYDSDLNGKIELSDAIRFLQILSKAVDAGSGSIEVNLCHVIMALKTLSGFQTERYELIWSDEFDGSELNSSKWRKEIGGWGWGNAELQYHLAKNVTVEDGFLKITAQKETYLEKQFTSGRITSAGLFSVRYGIIEARIKLPKGVGLWPAFWMIGNSKFSKGWPHCGEIDILETGKAEDIENLTNNYTLHSSLHYASDTGEHVYKTYAHQLADSLSDDFHLFRVEWDDRRISFYLDHAMYYSVEFSEAGEPLEEFQDCFFLIMNLSVGGIFTGILPGDEDKVFLPEPQVMEVDWVRVYQKISCGECVNPLIPACPDFAVFKDILSMTSEAIAMDVNAKLDIWNNFQKCSVPSKPYEGSNSLCFTAKSGDWAGFGIRSLYPKNFSAYADDTLQFMVKTKSEEPFAVGVKSGYISGAGESWVFFRGPGADPFGFVRDDQWRLVSIPMSDFKRTDFSQVTVPFMLSTCVLKSDFTLELDAIAISDTGTCMNPVPEAPVYQDYVIINETIGYGSRFGFDVEGRLDVWKNLVISEDCTDSFEGIKSLKLTAQPGDWFGMGIQHTSGKDMSRFAGGTLHVSLKTTVQTPFKIGIKSHITQGKGESWIEFNGSGGNPYGFSPDGQWHEVIIPMTAFQRTDLTDVTQLFMLAGEPSNQSIEIMLDNMYWACSSGNPLPPCNNYLVFSDTVCGTDQLLMDLEGSLKVWNNLTVETSSLPEEGKNAWKMTAQPGLWFGAGIALNDPKNMIAFANRQFHLSLKTTSQHPFKIGISDSGGSESWIYFIPGNDPAGFIRDGAWRQLTFPVSAFQRTDIASVKQVFMIAGDAPVMPVEIELDNLFWENTAPADTPLPNKTIRQNVVVFSETTGGTDYFKLDSTGSLDIWEYSDLTMTDTAPPFEGNRAWRFSSNTGRWFGIGVRLFTPKDLSAYGVSGSLSFAIKTSDPVPFKIGVSSGNVNGWKIFTPLADPYQFKRNGTWQRIKIPLKDFGISINGVNQLFMLSAGEGNPVGVPFSIEIDDVYWENGQTVVITDSDSDLMPDAWEQVVIDHDPNDAVYTISDVKPTDDFDGDGATNLKEFRRGTSPVRR